MHFFKLKIANNHIIKSQISIFLSADIYKHVHKHTSWETYTSTNADAYPVLHLLYIHAHTSVYCSYCSFFYFFHLHITNVLVRKMTDRFAIFQLIYCTDSKQITLEHAIIILTLFVCYVCSLVIVKHVLFVITLENEIYLNIYRG